MTQTIQDVFASHAFLRGLDDRTLLGLASGAQPFTARPGEFIARAGEPARKFFLIQSGRIELGEGYGDHFAPIQEVGPGGVFGWSWVVEPHTWQFSARAAGPVGGLAFDGEWLREQCEGNPELGYKLLKALLGAVVAHLATARRMLSAELQPAG